MRSHIHIALSAHIHVAMSMVHIHAGMVHGAVIHHSRCKWYTCPKNTRYRYKVNVRTGNDKTETD